MPASRRGAAPSGASRRTVRAHARHKCCTAAVLAPAESLVGTEICIAGWSRGKGVVPHHYVAPRFERGEASTRSASSKLKCSGELTAKDQTRTSTLSIPLGSNVSSAWQVWPPQSDWSAAAAFDFRLISGTTNRASCAPVYGRVEICSYAYGNTNWLGIANVWTNGEHIVQATVQLNDSYFHSASSYNTPSWRRFVVCQELGHAVGLDHQDVNQNNVNLGSCMDYTGDPTGKLGTNGPLHNLGPGKHDFEQLDKIYAHLDASQLSSTRLNSTGTGARLPRGEQGRKLGQARAGLTPREWGRAVAF